MNKDQKNIKGEVRKLCKRDLKQRTSQGMFINMAPNH